MKIDEGVLRFGVAKGGPDGDPRNYGFARHHVSCMAAGDKKCAAKVRHMNIYCELRPSPLSKTSPPTFTKAVVLPPPQKKKVPPAVDPNYVPIPKKKKKKKKKKVAAAKAKPAVKVKVIHPVVHTPVGDGAKSKYTTRDRSRSAYLNR
ncbi:hypothetical protein TrLO_g11351 [Triparma laevis f. longispina]|uniref:Uncharacterized protein n=1 Tax=Triparma laevis f. longispina TaxID=1714387 RepID=A0A9W7F315_9STRA|nr:hypothetical protein TrLO_g11351 [Triparma laevis f. longispina]